MTFTYDLTTDIGKVRLALGDVTDGTGLRPDGNNFEDEEIDTFLVLEDDDVELATARALEVLANQWASRADLQVGPRKESLSQIAARYAEQAKAIRERRTSISVGTIDLAFAAVGD